MNDREKAARTWALDGHEPLQIYSVGDMGFAFLAGATYERDRRPQECLNDAGLRIRDRTFGEYLRSCDLKGNHHRLCPFAGSEEGGG